jgi:hypothetical protein
MSYTTSTTGILDEPNRRLIFLAKVCKWVGKHVNGSESDVMLAEVVMQEKRERPDAFTQRLWDESVRTMLSKYEFDGGPVDIVTCNEFLDKLLTRLVGNSVSRQTTQTTSRRATVIDLRPDADPPPPRRARTDDFVPSIPTATHQTFTVPPQQQIGRLFQGLQQSSLIPFSLPPSSPVALPVSVQRPSPIFPSAPASTTITQVASDQQKNYLAPFRVRDIGDALKIVVVSHNDSLSQTALICAFINRNGILVLLEKLEKLEELGNSRKLTQYMRDATEDDQSRSFRVKTRITKVSGITSNMNGIEMMRTFLLNYPMTS